MQCVMYQLTSVPRHCKYSQLVLNCSVDRMLGALLYRVAQRCYMGQVMFPGCRTADFGVAYLCI